MLLIAMGFCGFTGLVSGSDKFNIPFGALLAFVHYHLWLSKDGVVLL